MTETRETYAAWKARIFEQQPEAHIKAVFRVDGCVGAHAYAGDLLIESFLPWLHEGYETMNAGAPDAA